ncbi:MAG: hypothetical protein GDA38_06580 [Hormoscilla sp. SP12CHS1]|nr:hypothetical protein [Hormoscilla sp. SP12CHS1]
MAFLRQVLAPFLILLVFLVALLAVSARIFLPNDMAAPAPIEDVAPSQTDAVRMIFTVS